MKMPSLLGVVAAVLGLGQLALAAEIPGIDFEKVYCVQANWAPGPAVAEEDGWFSTPRINMPDIFRLGFRHKIRFEPHDNGAVYMKNVESGKYVGPANSTADWVNTPGVRVGLKDNATEWGLVPVSGVKYKIKLFNNEAYWTAIEPSDYQSYSSWVLVLPPRDEVNLKTTQTWSIKHATGRIDEWSRWTC